MDFITLPGTNIYIKVEERIRILTTLLFYIGITYVLYLLKYYNTSSSSFFYYLTSFFYYWLLFWPITTGTIINKKK